MRYQDQRAHARAPLRRRCWCESGSITIYAQIGNLSEGGLFVKTFAPLVEGARTRVRWDLGEQESDTIEAEAVVVWRRPSGNGGEPSGMGLKFEGIGSEERERIRRHVESLLVSSGETPPGDAGSG